MNLRSSRPLATRIKLPVLLLLTTCAVLAGCISHTHAIPKNQQTLKAQAITKSALLEKLTTQSKAITSLMVTKSSLKASRMLSGEAVTDYHDVNGVIAVNRPAHIYLEISQVFTLVEMVSDGSQYRVSIPWKTRFGVGDVAAPPVPDVGFQYNLRPSHILDALFVDGEKFMGDPDVVPILTEGIDPQPDGIHLCSVILFARKSGEPLEELWFDRTIMEVSRKIQFKPDGKVEADIRYSDYATFDSIRFPKSIVISRPIENYSLNMRLDKLEFNKPMDAQTFVLNRPDGVVDVDLNTGKEINQK